MVLRPPDSLLDVIRLAGISTAIALKKQLNFDNFVVSLKPAVAHLYLSCPAKIYEKANAVGGTWRVRIRSICGHEVAEKVG